MADTTATIVHDDPTLRPADPHPHVEPPRRDPRPSSYRRVRESGWAFPTLLAAIGVLAVILLAVLFWPKGTDRTDVTTRTPPPAAVTSPTSTAKVTAIEVEFVPRNLTKMDDHAHPLDKQECAGKAGKKVKVAAGKTPDGRQIWDWYQCR